MTELKIIDYKLCTSSNEPEVVYFYFAMYFRLTHRLKIFSNSFRHVCRLGSERKMNNLRVRDKRRLTLAKHSIVSRLTGARIAIDVISAMSIIKTRSAVAFIYIRCNTRDRLNNRFANIYSTRHRLQIILPTNIRFVPSAPFHSIF